jgi:hypothetical protein
MTALDAALRRFHAAITGAAPLADAAELIEADDVDALARLHVYAHAYTARIGNVLAFEYPKLVAVRGGLGDLVAPYLRAHPPAHPSLREVGRHLAGFLADRGEPAHLVDLAALERARTEAFDGGADVEPLARDHLAAIDPADFPAVHLQLVPSSRLVALTTSADDLWDAVETGQPPPDPAPATRTVLVWRRDVTVVHRTLEPDEATLIADLAAGTTFAAACDRLADHPSPAERALALLLRWLDAEILDGSPTAPISAAARI